MKVRGFVFLCLFLQSCDSTFFSKIDQIDSAILAYNLILNYKTETSLPYDFFLENTAFSFKKTSVQVLEVCESTFYQIDQYDIFKDDSLYIKTKYSSNIGKKKNEFVGLLKDPQKYFLQQEKVKYVYQQSKIKESSFADRNDASNNMKTFYSYKDSLLKSIETCNMENESCLSVLNKTVYDYDRLNRLEKIVIEDSVERLYCDSKNREYKIIYDSKRRDLFNAVIVFEGKKIGVFSLKKSKGKVLIHLKLPDYKYMRSEVYANDKLVGIFIEENQVKSKFLFNYDINGRLIKSFFKESELEFTSKGFVEIQYDSLDRPSKIFHQTTDSEGLKRGKCSLNQKWYTYRIEQ